MSAFGVLGHLEELDEERLFLDVSVAGAELHEEVLQQVLVSVFVGSDPHDEDPESQRGVKIQCLGQAIIQNSDRHLENNRALRLLGQKLLEHVDQRLVHLLGANAEKFRDVELVET